MQQIHGKHTTNNPIRHAGNLVQMFTDSNLEAELGLVEQVQGGALPTSERFHHYRDFVVGVAALVLVTFAVTVFRVVA